MSHRQQTGRLGEDLAAEYLQARAYRIIERNYRTPFGELDIIARDEQTIVFAEVRTSKNAGFIDPIESISGKKKDHLIGAANYWMLAKNYNRQFSLRFDLLAIILKPPGQTGPRIDHLIGFLEA